MLRSFGRDLEHIEPHLTLVGFRGGEVIKHEGRDIEAIYFPTQGLISSRAVLQSGHEIECALIGRTNALGIVGALGFHNMSARFVCLTDGYAWRAPVAPLIAARERLAVVNQQLTLFAMAQLGYAVHGGVCNAMHPADQRLARWLVTAVDLLGHGELRMPQEELASVLGLQRSAVNPVLQKLKAEGMLDVARGRIIVSDAERLGRRACECRLPLRRALRLDGPPDAHADDAALDLA